MFRPGFRHPSVLIGASTDRHVWSMGRRVRGTLCIVLAVLALALPMTEVRAAEVPFGPQQVISTDTGDPTSVRAVDLDRDGDHDVLLTLYYDDKVVWHNWLYPGRVYTDTVADWAQDCAEGVVLEGTIVGRS